MKNILVVDVLHFTQDARTRGTDLEVYRLWDARDIASALSYYICHEARKFRKCNFISYIVWNCDLFPSDRNVLFQSAYSRTYNLAKLSSRSSNIHSGPFSK